MVVCLADGQDPSARCAVPQCRGCGRDMLPDDRTARQNIWRLSCGCSFQRREVEWSDQEIAAARDELAEQGVPSSTEVARSILNGLAETGTEVRIEMPRGLVVVTAARLSEVVGRDVASAT